MCSDLINGKQDELDSSDFINTTMLATQNFNAILEQIQSSCLNFQIQLSPFSAIISLKKSFIKDKCGNLVLPSDGRENKKNEAAVGAVTENTTVKNEVEENAHIIENLQLELSKLVYENKKYEEKVREQEEEISDLYKKVKVKNEVVNKLHQQLKYLKTKTEADLKDIKKSQKAELKSWRKELGEEKRQKVNLEKKIEVIQNEMIEEMSEQKMPKMLACENSEDISTIKNTPKPEQFPLTRNGFNYRPSSAAQAFSFPRNCNHEKQCVLRQPFPPPLPALTPLVNMSSLYHTRILSGDLDWGSTCSYCFRIEYEKYGCESCVWIKCFGDLHGFPDLNPYHYRKHLDEDN